MFLKITVNDLIKDNLLTFACTDLGAFNEIGKNILKSTPISGVVIMEDRLPDFFISYDKFQANTDTTLNRHGPFKFLYTQNHLKELIKELHSQNIYVYLGFWGQIIDPNKKGGPSWLSNHPELWNLYNNNHANHDLDPLVTLQPENISFAQFIVNQFNKLRRDFNFDGLFLGDGLNGYRLFVDPNKYEDQESTKEFWTNFYRIIAQGVHKLNCQLLAYDCLGLSPNKAIFHGADYLSQTQVGLDYLIVQTYPTAWGKKWLKKFPGFDYKSCLDNLKATKKILKNSDCKVLYTLEMGDRVEDWKASYRITQKQLKHYKYHADGKLLVWANELFYRLLK